MYNDFKFLLEVIYVPNILNSSFILMDLAFLIGAGVVGVTTLIKGNSNSPYLEMHGLL